MSVTRTINAAWSVDKSVMSRLRSEALWPFPDLKKPAKLFHFGSSIVVPTVGIFSKILIDWLNKVVVYNKDTLINAVSNRPPNTPLITVCNHHSCLDDPLLWGILNWEQLLNSKIMRWSSAAHDICFTKHTHAKFFALGKTFPLYRGNGVYQKAMDFCLDLLNGGKWVHFFPEGKVNLEKENIMRIKWGIGRLISECQVSPFVIPFWHVGMDSILPNRQPYIPQVGKVVTIVVGKPMDFSDIRIRLKQEMKSAMEQRKIITDIIQEEFSNIKSQAEKLHRSN